MRNEYKNHKINVTSIDNNNNIITQDTLTIQEHNVRIKYLMLSLNNFISDEPVLCPGYFNKKTNFLIGELNSILACDEKLNLMHENQTSDLIGSDNFMIYPVPVLNMIQQDSLEYKDNNGDITDIELTYNLGKTFGGFLTGTFGVEDIDTHPGFIKLFVNTKKGLSLNKNIILNSNYKFALGILDGYYKLNGDKSIFINDNVNIYTFTVILNYLGASYSIRNSRDRKKLFIQLPGIFSEYVDSRFIKPKEYKFNKIIQKLELTPITQTSVADISTNSLVDSINSGKLICVPFNSIEFQELEYNAHDRMFDLTSENHNATNYSIPMTPILKNSDGDILAASGIFTKEGLADSKPFSPDNKEYYKNLNDGSINQWIADDAILGLYNATSHK